ncbi:MAG: DUF6036 family nucleotidyltransferase [Thermoanaerobaculia bacterium]
MNLTPSFQELLECFGARQVRALIVGGYALAYHARPRYTKDIDLWIDTEPENIDRLLLALNDFGFGELGLCGADFSQPGQFVQLGYPPNRIDLMTSIPGLEFGSAWARRVREWLGTVEIAFLARDDLILAKKAAGRAQDLADLEVLERG